MCNDINSPLSFIIQLVVKACYPYYGPKLPHPSYPASCLLILALLCSLLHICSICHTGCPCSRFPSLIPLHTLSRYLIAVILNSSLYWMNFKLWPPFKPLPPSLTRRLNSTHTLYLWFPNARSSLHGF